MRRTNSCFAIVLVFVVAAMLSCNQKAGSRSAVTAVGEHAAAEGNDGLVDVGVASNNPAFSEAAKLVIDHRFDDAIGLYKKLCASEKGKQRAIAYWGLGAAYSSANKDILAVNSYIKSLAIDSNNSGVYVGLGSAYSQLGDKEKAIIYYKAAIGRDQKCTEAYWGLAIAYDEIGDRALAKDYARKYISLEPASKYRSIMEGILNK